MRLIPQGNNLVVRPIDSSNITRGGLAVPDIVRSNKPYRFADVIEVGPGRVTADGKLIPCNCKVGDVVAYAAKQGVPFPLEDDDGNETEMLLLNEQFVMGVVVDLPRPTMIAGLDGRLLQLTPQSMGRSDGSYAQLDAVARARVDGIIDTQGDTLAQFDALDEADRRAE